jgi:hypothetical protein
MIVNFHFENLRNYEKKSFLKPYKLIISSSGTSVFNNRVYTDWIRLSHELANPHPGFLRNPILEGVVGQLLTFIGPAIQEL